MSCYVTLPTGALLRAYDANLLREDDSKIVLKNKRRRVWKHKQVFVEDVVFIYALI